MILRSVARHKPQTFFGIAFWLGVVGFAYWITGRTYSKLDRQSDFNLTSAERGVPSFSHHQIECVDVAEFRTMEHVLDYARCPMNRELKAYFYPVTSLGDLAHPSLSALAERSQYLTSTADEACIFVALLEKTQNLWKGEKQLLSALSSLKYWETSGSNHLVVILNGDLSLTVHRTGTEQASRSVGEDPPLIRRPNVGQALVAATAFPASSFRPFLDILLPFTSGNASAEPWAQMPSPTPILRQFLVTFAGQYFQAAHQAGGGGCDNEGGDSPGVERVSKMEKMVLAALETWKVEAEKAHTSTRIKVELSCRDRLSIDAGPTPDWNLCTTAQERGATLSQSTFALLLPALDPSRGATWGLQVRLAEALQHGAVPVIVGAAPGQLGLLPLTELIDWTSAAVFLPAARLSALLTYLRAFSQADIFRLRLQGRELWQKYFSSPQRALDAALAVLRKRLLMPAPAARDYPPDARDSQKDSRFSSGPGPVLASSSAEGASSSTEAEESKHSRTVVRDVPLHIPYEGGARTMPSYLYQAWTGNGHGLDMSLPFTPFVSLLPAEAKFTAGFNLTFDNKLLGGHYPQEMFTVVMVTYRRERALLAALERLKGLPFLAKVVVVWNDPVPPGASLTWPDIGVPVEVVRTPRNSMNYRYLPFAAIETEAVLNLDDDTSFPQDSLLQAFRVWRENRGRLVGFIGRSHSWDVGARRWTYGFDDSEHVLEFSMIIPSCSFMHKYYFYLYTYGQPQAVFDLVDRTFNCEDLAMSFLVAHHTRQPPIKVKAAYTRVCPGCTDAISAKADHLETRHFCLNKLASIYGYLPLIYTSFDVDKITILS